MQQRAAIVIHLILLVVIAMPARGELQVSEQVLAFGEVSLAGHRIAYAAIDVSDLDVSSLQSAEVLFYLACPDALEGVTLVVASLWDDLLGDWDLALNPDSGMMGLCFREEQEEGVHAELCKLFTEWSGVSSSAILALAFDCADVDCACSPAVQSGVLRLATTRIEQP